MFYLKCHKKIISLKNIRVIKNITIIKCLKDFFKGPTKKSKQTCATFQSKSKQTTNYSYSQTSTFNYRSLTRIFLPFFISCLSCQPCVLMDGWDSYPILILWSVNVLTGFAEQTLKHFKRSFTIFRDYLEHIFVVLIECLEIYVKISHTGNTRPSRTCVIQEHRFYPMSLSEYHGCRQYHESMSLPWVLVNTMSPSLYHEFFANNMTIPWA